MGGKEDKKGAGHLPQLSEYDQKTVEQLDVVFSGWVLKKKKKKLQGYAKRFLILTKQGLLTYSISPDKPTRDAIEVPHASVTSSARHGTIHVDSGSSVFHLKMLNPTDFETWRNHLRSFISERQAGSAQQVYVSSGNDIVLVDVIHIFAGLEATETLLQDVKRRADSLIAKAQHKSATDATMDSFGAKGTDDHDEQLALSVAIGNLEKEFAKLKYNIESKIPSVGDPNGTFNSFKSKQSMIGIENSSRSRLSISSQATNHTDSAIFYDAHSYGEEFFMDLNHEDDADGSHSEASATEDDEDSAAETDDSKNGLDTPFSSHAAMVQHRKVLPAKVSGDEISLFSMLKSNVGKDLSTISFPVSFNCPLSLLQAAAEEYEYASELLERAAKTEDWVERICVVGAFAVSGYASTKLRASRKPFNPLLGETFECVREDKHLRFLAEKVVHQPPVIATYAEGRGWKCQGWSAVKNKFWGKSLELIPEGCFRLEFADGDVFSVVKPSSFMRNLLAGNKYLEHVGELVVTNENTGQRMVVEFKEGTMWGGQASRNHVVGTVYDANDGAIAQVKGKWCESLVRQRDKENFQVLWVASEMPLYAEEYYGFTYFAMSLNEITPDCQDILPPTDSRLRPDQRAFEEGNVDEAEKLKHQLEEAQRARRRQMQADGSTYQPKWFHKSNDGEPQWRYGGPEGEEYFKIRRKANEEGAEMAWKSTPNIFDV